MFIFTALSVFSMRFTVHARRMSLACLMLVFVVLLLTWANIAMAQTVAAAPPSTAIDIQPYLNDLMRVVMIAMSGVVGWVSLEVKKRTGNAALASVLDMALTQGTQFAYGMAHELIAKNVHPLTVRNAIVAQATSYALEHAPDAMAHFGFDQTSPEKLILARLAAIDPSLVAPVVQDVAPPVYQTFKQFTPSLVADGATVALAAVAPDTAPTPAAPAAPPVQVAPPASAPVAPPVAPVPVPTA